MDDKEPQHLGHPFRVAQSCGQRIAVVKINIIGRGFLIVLGFFADRTANEATDRCAADRSESTTTGERETCDTTCPGAKSGVLILLRHTRTTT